MMSSPDLTDLLRASRPSAPADLRARVREIAAAETARTPWPRLRLPGRRVALVALPAAAALALASAGVLGLARSDGDVTALRGELAETDATNAEVAPAPSDPGRTSAQDSAIGPTPGRAERGP